MRNGYQKLLITFMVLWMPFCCCQVRAASMVMAHLMHGSSEGLRESLPACCATQTAHARPSQASSPGSASGTSTELHGCCSQDEDHNSRSPMGESCCSTCKDRALPPAPAELNIDTLGTFDFVGSLFLTDIWNAHALTCDASIASHDTGPPLEPSGRQTLCLHSTLLI